MTTTAPAAKKRKWKLQAILGTVAALVLLGGGAAIGATLPDPTISGAYIQLAEGMDVLDEKYQSLQKDYATLEELYLKQKSGIEEREASVGARENAAAAAEKKVTEAEAAVKKREGAVAGAEATKAKNTVSDGTWSVGRHIEPGVYATGAEVGSSCYWAILASGTNGSDIIQNDLPGGGRPTVTLSAGQDFKSTRCGSWIKQ